MLVSLYEDYREGIVSREDFGRIRGTFEAKRKHSEQAIMRLREESEKEASNRDRAVALIGEFGKYQNITTLTRTIAVSLIQSVRVHENGRLEVIMDCDDEIREVLERAQMVSGERQVI